MNKKAIALKFLLNLIIGIVIFGFFIGCTAKVYNLALKKDPFYETINFIETVSADGKVKFDYKMINIPKRKALIGFSEGAKQVEYFKDGKRKYSIESQNACGNKTCLCLCDDFTFEIKDKGSLLEKYHVLCHEKITKCRQFDNINFAESVYLDEKKSKMWKGGFLLNKDSKAVYIRKFDNAISVCDVGSCTNAENQKTT